MRGLLELSLVIHKKGACLLSLSLSLSVCVSAALFFKSAMH